VEDGLISVIVQAWFGPLQVIIPNCDRFGKTVDDVARKRQSRPRLFLWAV